MYTALFLSLATGVFFSNNKIIYIFLLLFEISRLIYCKKYFTLFLSIVVLSAFCLQITHITNNSCRNYSKTLILKINPTDFKKVNDIYTGIASTGSTKYSILVKADKSIEQTKNKIIYLKATEFEKEDISLPRNFGEFNYKNYYRSKNIFEKITINKFEVRKVPPNNFYERLLLSRWRLKTYFDKFPASLQFNTKSLILGYNDSNPETDMNLKNLSKLGIIHLFSLSGMHLVLIIGFFRKIFSYFRLLTIQTLDYIFIIVLPIYCLFVGSKTSICRATILVIVKIIIDKLNKKVSTTEIFSLSLIIGLFIDPYCLTMLGGQLTYLLSFSLIYLRKYSTLKLTVVVNLLCVPLILFNNYELNILTILVNIIAVPIFEVFILPSTFIAAIVGPHNLWIIDFLEFINHQIYFYLDKVAQIKIFNLVIGKLNLIIVVVSIVLSLCCISAKNRKKKTFFVKVISCLIIGNILLNKIPFYGQVTLVDVGQGDSILITTPIIRKTMLIDTGGKLNFGKTIRKDRSYGVIKSTIPYLKSQGISKINAVFLSHKDADHIGDLEKLLENFKVDNIYMGSGVQKNSNIKRILIPFSKKTRNHLVLAGERINFGIIDFNILAPLKSGIGENSDSMVIYSNIGSKKWLFTGDLDRENELKIYDKYHPKVDYLKVGHHGSKTSSDPQFIGKIKPQKAFISVAKKNRYGHPNKETLNTLKGNHVKIYQTADYGMIVWRYDLFNNNKLEFGLDGKNEYK